MNSYQINSIPCEKLRELVEDIRNDGGLHNGLVFNAWKCRNHIHGIKIKDVSPLFHLSYDNLDIDAVLNKFLNK